MRYSKEKISEIYQIIREKLKAKEFISVNFSFRSGNICCFSEKDIEKRQNEVLHEHYLLGNSDVVNNKVYNLIDSNLYTMLYELILDKKPMGPYRVFREHTNTQLYYEYDFEHFEVFLAVHWSGVIIVKLSSQEFIMITKEMQYYDELYCVYVVREILNRTAEKHKLVLLHAAAMNIDGYGLLIIGPKGAGKTTFVSSLSATNLNCEMISNDRTYVESLKNEIRLYYYPLKFRFGFGTIRALPVLKDFMVKKYEDRKPEKVKILQSNEPCKSKFSLTLGEYQEVFSKKVVCDGKLFAIVVPEIVIDSDILESVGVSEEEAKKVMQENNFTAHDDLFLEPWLIKRECTISELEEYSQKEVENILQKVPIVKVRYGTRISRETLAKHVRNLIKDIRRGELVQ